MIRYDAPSAEDADAAISSYFYLPGKCRASACCRLHPEKMERWRWRDILLELHPESLATGGYFLYIGGGRKRPSPRPMSPALLRFIGKNPKTGKTKRTWVELKAGLAQKTASLFAVDPFRIATSGFL
ncbi:MAG: hypothetical protein ACUVV5_08470 [Candidatus Aminicenantales bacterium]